MKKQKLKVLHLPANIRWIMDATVQAENDLGIETREMFVTRFGLKENEPKKNVYPTPYYSGRRKSLAYVKHVLKLIRYFFHYTRLVMWADVIHWQYSTRLRDANYKSGNYDFDLLKLLKKPSIAQFHGSDFRDNEYWATVTPWWPESYGEENLKRFQKIAKDTQKNFADADFIFALGHGLYPFVKPENRSRAIVMERAIELRHYVEIKPYKQSGKVTIVHGPSNPSVKGTKYILAAVENLKKEFDFDFILVENCEHDEVLDALEKADIVIDQLIAGDYGLFAVEGMNAGAAVVANVVPMLREVYPPDLPVIQADPNTIEGVLRRLLSHPEEVILQGSKGPEYANRVHECHAALGPILDAYLFAAKRKGNKKVEKKIEYFIEKHQRTR